jgi:hypothetical protein
VTHQEELHSGVDADGAPTPPGCARLCPFRDGPGQIWTPVASLAARPPSVGYLTLKLCQLVTAARWVAVLAIVTRRRYEPLLAGLYRQL